MPQNKEKTCCFTGHRQIPSAQLEAIARRTLDAIVSLYKEGYRHFITGGALGFDTLCARIVLQLKTAYPDMTLTLVLPCRDQDALWQESDRLTFAQQKSRADEVVCLSEKYTASCMRTRNQYMVDQSSAIIAYLTHSNSGAGQTVRMAQKQGLRIIMTQDEP